MLVVAVLIKVRFIKQQQSSMLVDVLLLKNPIVVVAVLKVKLIELFQDGSSSRRALVENPIVSWSRSRESSIDRA